MDEVVGAIIFILNSCAGDEWNLFETCLSDDYIRMIISENSWWFKIPDIERSNDNDVLHDMYDNEDIATNLSEGYLILEKLFVDWVLEALGKLNYENVPKIMTSSFKSSVFLNFNYTDTLEDVYDIDSDHICHIHGSCHSDEKEIFFGHGEIESIEATGAYLEIKDAFDCLWIE